MNEGLSKKITVYNLIATMLIVVYHWAYFVGLYSTGGVAFSNGLFKFYDTFGGIALGLFFIISGYLFYLGLTDKQSLSKKCKKRLFSLGVPFIVWNVLELLFILATGIINKNLDIGIIDILLGFSFVPLNGPLWYLFALLFLMALSPLILKLKDHPKIFLCILIGVFIGALAVGTFVKSEQPIAYWFIRLVYYLPMYLLGAYLGLCKSNVLTENKLDKKPVFLLSIAVSVAIFVCFIFIKKMPTYVEWILYRILPISVWLSIPSKAFENIKIGFPLKISFFIYALHMHLITIFNTLINKVLGNNMHVVVALLVHIGAIALLYLVCLLVAFVLKKILPKKIYGLFTGGRGE